MRLPDAEYGRLDQGGDGAGKAMRIGIAGYGIVGQALARAIADDRRFQTVAILARDPERQRDYPAPVAISTDSDAFAAAHPDIVVEATCCDETGARLCEMMLARGIDVVSASKRVIAARHADLSAAASHGARLLYSASVGGGAPVLETIDAARAAGPIREVVATLNGTVNFILHRMSESISFDDALGEAQRAGFAEADPEADLSGADAAAKLRIAALHAFGQEPRTVDVETEGLDEAAIDRIAANGERWVQVARLERRDGRVAASVRLEPLAALEGLEAGPAEWNAARVTLEDGRMFGCKGRGAGGAPTAGSILSDLERLIASTKSVAAC